MSILVHQSTFIWCQIDVKSGFLRFVKCLKCPKIQHFTYRASSSWGFPGEERYPLIYPAFPWLCLSKLASLFYITYHKSAYSDLICRKICRKNSVVFTLSSNEAHLGYDCNTHAVPSDFLYSIAYFFTKIKEPAYCGKLLLFILSWFFLQAQQRIPFSFPWSLHYICPSSL